MRWVWLLLVLCSFLAAQEEELIKSPEEIEEEIEASERQFASAKNMFVPWYTGPLITPSASMIPPGTMLAQPYIFVADNYATYNADRHSVGGTSFINMNPLVFLETGISPWMDIAFLLQGNMNWSKHSSSGGFGDLVVSPGFQVYSEKRYIPQIKVFIQQTFPTGAYKNLTPYKNGLDAAGGGAYKTQLGFIVGKLIFWQYPHPLRLRLSMGYTLPNDVYVKNFNVYGGGYGTRGTVAPGNTFGTDFGMELSLTQEFVFALDIVYTSSGPTTFSGRVGTTAQGGTIPAAPIGRPSSDNLSLAPAFEYNWSENLGVIGGVQFSVSGRNSYNFISAIVSACYVFPLTR